MNALFIEDGAGGRVHVVAQSGRGARTVATGKEAG